MYLIEHLVAIYRLFLIEFALFLTIEGRSSIILCLSIVYPMHLKCINAFFFQLYAYVSIYLVCLSKFFFKPQALVDISVYSYPIPKLENIQFEYLVAGKYDRFMPKFGKLVPFNASLS